MGKSLVSAIFHKLSSHITAILEKAKVPPSFPIIHIQLTEYQLFVVSIIVES